VILHIENPEDSMGENAKNNTRKKSYKIKKSAY
jgi:hypothetical protein